MLEITNLMDEGVTSHTTLLVCAVVCDLSLAFTKVKTSLKWYYDQKISSFFPSDFESVFTYRLTGKILNFEFYPKAVYFECKFWILRSAITHVQN